MLRRRTALLAAAPILALALAASAAPAQATAAHAPDLERFYQQRIDWQKCQLDPSDETGAELDRAGARCAEVTVPLDYRDPTGRTITVAISRIAASDTARRVGVLMVNGGGPGGPAVDMPPSTREHLKSVGPRYDVVGMDPRFVGRSTPLDCGWPTGTWARSAGLTRASFERGVRFQRELAAACGRRHAAELPHATTRNTARDMDVIRAALGERTMSYLGYSYGTYLGTVYSQLFPRRLDRVVLDSAIDPRRYGVSTMLADGGPAAERALRNWATWAARRHSSYGLGRTQAAVLATVDRVVRASGQRPLRLGDSSVDDQLVPMVLYMGVVDDRDAPRQELAAAVRALDEAARNGQAEPTDWLAEILHYIQTGAESRYGSAQASIFCGDVAAPTDPEEYWRRIQRDKPRLPVFGAMLHNVSPCAFWPVPADGPQLVRNGVPALIVAATGDSRTAYEHGQALHRQMTGSRLLTAKVSTHGVYGEYGSTCVDNVVNAYLDTGRLPARDLTCVKD